MSGAPCGPLQHAVERCHRCPVPIAGAGRERISGAARSALREHGVAPPSRIRALTRSGAVPSGSGRGAAGPEGEPGREDGLQVGPGAGGVARRRGVLVHCEQRQVRVGQRGDHGAQGVTVLAGWGHQGVGVGDPALVDEGVGRTVDVGEADGVPLAGPVAGADATGERVGEPEDVGGPTPKASPTALTTLRTSGTKLRL